MSIDEEVVKVGLVVFASTCGCLSRLSKAIIVC